jgi:hypothetical protein
VVGPTAQSDLALLCWHGRVCVRVFPLYFIYDYVRLVRQQNKQKSLTKNRSPGGITQPRTVYKVAREHTDRTGFRTSQQNAHTLRKQGVWDKLPFQIAPFTRDFTGCRSVWVTDHTICMEAVWWMYMVSYMVVYGGGVWWCMVVYGGVTAICFNSEGHVYCNNWCV